METEMPDDNDGQQSKPLVNVNLKDVGKETDKAVAEVLRALLLKPAGVTGDMLADGLGILGDRVRQKRLQNLKGGLEEARAKLEERCVDLKDITPPDEEETHLLVEGMSLSGDEAIRSLWSGLMTEALDPGSAITAERPFINVLESLSPQDARIIDFLAYKEHRASRLEKDLLALHERNSKHPESFEYETEMRRCTDFAISEIHTKSRDCGLVSLNDGWADNLLRLGVIERATKEELDEPRIASGHSAMGQHLVSRSVSDALTQIVREINKSTKRPQGIFARPGFKNDPSTTVRLTPFGRRLAFACGLRVGNGNI